MEFNILHVGAALWRLALHLSLTLSLPFKENNNSLGGSSRLTTKHVAISRTYDKLFFIHMIYKKATKYFSLTIHPMDDKVFLDTRGLF